jgi:hypothetical protein
MDFDNHSDYMGQDIFAGKFLTAQSGPIAQFLSGMPNWMNKTPEDINLALAVESLHNPPEGHILPGISLQEAIEANELGMASYTR